MILTYYTTEQKISNDAEKTDSQHFFISIRNFSVLNLFCRWDADQTFAERLIDIWLNIEKVDDFWQKLPKSKQPKSKSYVKLHDAVIDLFTPARFFFLPFLTLYQADNPMILFLYDDLMKLVKKIILHIFKPDTVNPCTTVSVIRKIDFDNKDNFLKVKDISLGFATEKCLLDLQKKRSYIQTTNCSK